MGRVSVPVGTTAMKTAPVSFYLPSPVLGSSAPVEFALSSLVPMNNTSWTLYFSPLSPGEKSTTLTISSFQGCVFPPNTFLATGTGT